jgi:hypothetical protein
VQEEKRQLRRRGDEGAWQGERRRGTGDCVEGLENAMKGKKEEKVKRRERKNAEEKLEERREERE